MMQFATSHPPTHDPGGDPAGHLAGKFTWHMGLLQKGCTPEQSMEDGMEAEFIFPAPFISHFPLIDHIKQGFKCALFQTTEK